MCSGRNLTHFFWEEKHIAKVETQINDEIRDAEVRVIGPHGEQIGIMSSREANKLALEQELDLVKISPNTNPPVCRIMDYGKYKFDQAKREKEQRKKQKVVELKEIQLSMTIDQRDLEIKAKHAEKFLTQGNKVKVVLKMRGRQQAYSAKGIEIVKSFYGIVSSLGTCEKEPKVEGRNVVVIIAPLAVKK